MEQLMHGILIPYAEKRSLADVVGAFTESISETGLQWLLLSVYADISSLETDSGIPNRQSRIDRQIPFSLTEIGKLAVAGEHIQECAIAAFRKQHDLEAYELEKSPRLFYLLITGADDYLWQICGQDKDVIDRIATHFTLAEKLSEEWFQKYLFRNSN
jgi:hypothetical protein